MSSRARSLDLQAHPEERGEVDSTGAVQKRPGWILGGYQIWNLLAEHSPSEEVTYHQLMQQLAAFGARQQDA